MKIICIADTHSQHRELIIEPADMIIHAGDFLRRTRPQDVKEFIEWFSDLPVRYRILIAGNHDKFVERHPENFQLYLNDKIIYLENSGVRLEGIQFWGSPLSLQYAPGWAFGYEAGQAEKLWKQIPVDTEILITHSPPYGYGDFSNEDRIHAGCEHLLERIALVRPQYHIFGHIHEGFGIYQNSSTVFINASNVNQAEELVNKPITISI